MAPLSLQRCSPVFQHRLLLLDAMVGAWTHSRGILEFRTLQPLERVVTFVELVSNGSGLRTCVSLKSKLKLTLRRTALES